MASMISELPAAGARACIGPKDSLQSEASTSARSLQAPSFPASRRALSAARHAAQPSGQTAAHSPFLGSPRGLTGVARHSKHKSSHASTQLRAAAPAAQADQPPGISGRIVKGPCFVVDDNIDTDQIIPAEYLTLVPSKPDEYEKLGSYAMVGLPKRYGKFIEEGAMKTHFPIVIAGQNFGCGSSREHAPVAMGAAGVKAVVAESYARIYFRNCVATGELYPVESEQRLCDTFQTGDEVTVDMEHDFVINHRTGEQFVLKPIGDAGPVIDAGGIFNFARREGMIPTRA